MRYQSLSQTFAGSSFLGAAAGTFAIAIFVVDTATTLDIAVAVLYVVVVLLAANLFQRRGVLLVASGCMALTVLSYLLSHGLSTGTPLVRCLMSLSAIAATTFLATERNRTQEALQRAQAELAHVARITTLGELTASIAHEVNQPLAGIVTNGAACLRWLGRNPAQVDEACRAVEGMISDGMRASEVVARLRALAKKTAPQRALLDLNQVVEDVLQLVQRELFNNRIALRLELARGLPPVLGDRVQLQQVVMNLLVNSIQAMAPLAGRARELLIRSQRQGLDAVLVELRDSGLGIDPHNVEHLFDAFFSTKPEGMGMGLSICRSIVEAHGGRVWASANEGPGATFHFTVPIAREPTSQ